MNVGFASAMRSVEPFQTEPLSRFMPGRTFQFFMATCYKRFQQQSSQCASLLFVHSMSRKAYRSGWPAVPSIRSRFFSILSATLRTIAIELSEIIDAFHISERLETVPDVLFAQASRQTRDVNSA